MHDIKKEDLKGEVIVAALNLGELTDQVERDINVFDVATYRRFLNTALERRARADLTGELGGGTRNVAYLRRAIEKLEYILSH